MKTRWTDAALGWMFSAGVHIVLLLGTALVFMEQLVAFDDDVTIICGFPAPKPVVPSDVPRDLVERKGTPSGEGQRFDPFEESTFSPGATEPWLPGSDIIPIDDDSGRRSSTPFPLAMSADHSRRSSEVRSRMLVPRRVCRISAG
jgi:hypothetical protein